MLEQRSRSFDICFMAKKVKLPADVNKRAKSIVDIATGESEDKTYKDEITLSVLSQGFATFQKIQLQNF
jgi:hypothetical protein